jgi:large subunit ribosomal protein L3
MPLGLLGLKVGMTQVYDDQGTLEPVTVLEVGPCTVLQVRNPDKEKDGYLALQLGFQDKPRRKATRPERGHVSSELKSKRREKRETAGVAIPPKPDCEPQRHIREFRLAGAAELEQVARLLQDQEKRAEERAGKASGGKESAGKEEAKKEPEKSDQHKPAGSGSGAELVGKIFTADGVFANVKAVDVIGTTKGRGTAGVMKRHGFHGLPASHGVKKHHRAPGSIGSLASNRGSGRPKKGRRMAGRYGNERVTVRNLKVVRIDPENNVVLVRGAVPGPNGGLVMIRPTNKKDVGLGGPVKQEMSAAKKGAAMTKKKK